MIAAIALASVLTLILLAIVLCYLFFYRPRIRRLEHERRTQRRREKEAEAGGGILDISAEAADDIARRDSPGTSPRLSALRFGMGSPRSKSDGIGVNADEFGNSPKRDATGPAELDSKGEIY